MSLHRVLVYILCMGAVIFLCRAAPFLFFRKREGGALAALLALAERVAPPVAMTVLAFNAVAGPLREDPGRFLPTLAASGVSALVHLWRRNALLSIFGGTFVYMVLIRLF